MILKVVVRSAAVLFGLAIATHGWAQTVHDAAAEFEQGWSTHSNPNGVWSYGYSSSFLGPVTLYTQTLQGVVNGPNAQDWVSPSVNNGEAPAAEFNNGPAYVGGSGEVDYPANSFALVAGIGGQYSDLVFTAPIKGSYSVSTSFRGDQAGVGTVVGVVVNGNVVFNSTITARGQTVPFAIQVSLDAGNTVVFSVGPGGGLQNTGLSATISGPPTISTLSPSSATAGGSALTMTVNGSGFLAGSAVQWNGSSLSTTYGGGNQLSASVPANLIVSQGSANITVVNPGGATSNVVMFTINAAVPLLSSLTPNSAAAGGPGFNLIVDGSGFLVGSTVVWNGSSLSTTYGGGNQLSASAPANLIASQGSANVIVVNPGGATSNPVTFTISAPTAQTIHDAAAEFEKGWSTHSNPNGVWSYGYSSSFLGPVTLYTQTLQGVVNGPNAQDWVSPSVNNGEAPAAEFNNGPAYVGGSGEVDYPANSFALVAGIGGQYSDLVFTAPINGMYSVSTSFRGDQVGVSTVVGVVVNGNVVFNSTITARGQTVPFATQVSLDAGNTVVFSVGPGGGLQNTGLSATITGPLSAQPSISLVANAEGESPTIAPNTWVEVKGSNLAPSGDTRVWRTSDFVGGNLPASLDGVGVTVNGKPAYIYYISPTQINILTPPDAMSGAVQVMVTANGSASAAYTTQAQATSPSFFVINGGPYVLAQHSANYSLVGPANLYPGSTTPAEPGETVVLYANGFGQTAVPVISGSATQSGNLSPLPAVTIGGIPATVPYAALISPGLYQINVVVPANAASGDNQLAATIDGAATSPVDLLTIQSSTPATPANFHVAHPE